MSHQERIDRALSRLGTPPGRPLARRLVACATPGASIAVIEDRELVLAQGFGRRGNEVPGMVDASTPFQAGSISKPVFALAVMCLVERGLLDLDADVGEHLRSWSLPEQDGWRPRISLRQLLSHSAGTTVHGFAGYPAQGPWPTPAQILSGTPPANNPPVRVDLLPGLQHRYSGGGITIAQLVVADLLDRPFAEVMRELVLGPLGMTDSSFEQPLPPGMAAAAALGHPWNGQPLPGGWRVHPEMAAAGLWTTARDLGLLGLDLLRALDGKPSQLGLGRETIAAMLRPQLPGTASGSSYFGIGWQCAGDGESFRFGHGGQTEGFTAHLRLFARRGAGVVVMINSMQGWPLIEEVLAAIGHAYGWPLPAPPADPPPLDTEIYAGTYASPGGLSVAVAAAADGLLVTVPGQRPLPLQPRSATEFTATALSLRLRFVITSGGVESMALEQGDRSIELVRQPG